MDATSQTERWHSSSRQFVKTFVRMIKWSRSGQRWLVFVFSLFAQLLAHCPPQHGGLQPLAIGLFHQQDYIRDMTVGLLNVIREYTVRADPRTSKRCLRPAQVGFQFLQSLNQFLRYSYIRQVYERQPSWNEGFPQDIQHANGGVYYKAPSNHSQVSLGVA